MVDEYKLIWEKLNEFNVRYLTIGGLAVNLYGYPRNTGDIDILIEDTLENRKKFRSALKEYGLGDFPQIETMQFVTGFSDFNISYGLRLDVMTAIKGFDSVEFEVLYNQATISLYDEIPVYFIDYENLIISKKAANRPKDLLDIEELEKINKKA